MTIVNAQETADRLAVRLIEECIKEAGSEGIPNGHLYAMLMGMISIDTYNMIIGRGVELGVITNTHDLLKYVPAE